MAFASRRFRMRMKVVDVQQETRRDRISRGDAGVYFALRYLAIIEKRFYGKIAFASTFRRRRVEQQLNSSISFGSSFYGCAFLTAH